MKLLYLMRKIIRLLKETQELNIIRRSGLFDKNWYVQNNHDVVQANINPALHYLYYGGMEGRDPGPNFSSTWYLETYEDVRKAGINPLVHFLRHGRAEGRRICPSQVILVPPAQSLGLLGKNMDAIRRDPIIVHQMGKVGSQTVLVSLSKAFEALGLKVPVYHAHALNGFDLGRQYAIREQGQRNPSSRLAALEYGERLRKQIDDNPAQHWNIVSLVRDPIARNIATFFHNLVEYIPDWHERYDDGTLSTQEVQALFLRVASAYDVLDDWFDVQMKSIPAFGIDVYATPFPSDVGYKIYLGAAQANLLLIRLENLKECAKSAIQEFLGLEDFTLLNTNLADEKDYAVLYRAFKEMPLPMEYVERIYNTQFARHFYSDVELDAFAKRWTKNAVSDFTSSTRAAEK